MADSWSKVIVTAVVAPVVLLVLSTFFVPGIIDDANRTEALRTGRLKKALDIGDHNRDFTSRIHVLNNRMHMFNEQNVRGRLSRADVRNTQKRFEKEHTDDYLDLEKMAWWWYWDLEREGEIFGLLSPSNLSDLHGLLEEYGKNAAASVGAITPLWRFLSSSEYSISNDNQKRIELLESEVNTQLTELSKIRAQIVKDLAACFAQSQCAPSKRPTASPSATK